MLVGGCPRAQTARRVVYVSTPPPQLQSQASTPAEVLVIEPPANEEPEALPPESPVTTLESTPKRPPRRRHAIRPDSTSEAEADDDAEPASPSAEVPVLESRQDSQRLATLRRDLTASQESTRRRLAQLDHAQLGQGDRRTLDDAKAFLSQSERELARGEVIRASNLARKAALLVSAIEQSH